MRRLYRPRSHRVLGGVAAGLALRFGLPIWLMRLIWLILFIPGGLPGLLPYVALLVIIPAEE